MALLVILAVVFILVALMVILGEKYGKSMEPEAQAKYSKWVRILVFVLLIVALIKAVIE